jgi:two-component system LytT family sensor kinase
MNTRRKIMFVFWHGSVQPPDRPVRQFRASPTGAFAVTFCLMRRRTFVSCILAWTAIGLFFFTQGLTQKILTGDKTPWWHYLAIWMSGVYLNAALTPGIIWLGARFPIERKRWLRRGLLHLLFSLMFSIVQIGLHGVVVWELGLFPAMMTTLAITWFILASVGFHQTILAYWYILGVQYSLRYYRERQEFKLQSAELKTQLVRAQLGALNMQLQPHFLFNTLNAIMVLVRQQSTAEAERMLAKLSDLLRCVLEDVNTPEVPLARELEYVRLYLSIEEVRFQDRLRIEISADSSLFDAMVPHMVLQPIVENAVKHGICRSSAAELIRIHAKRAGDALEISVQDDGPGLDPQPVEGVGLSNTRARLSQLYGSAARLTLLSASPHGTIVTITLPFRILDNTMEVHAVQGADR